jgi:hypothetical protein
VAVAGSGKHDRQKFVGTMKPIYYLFNFYFSRASHQPTTWWKTGKAAAVVIQQQQQQILSCLLYLCVWFFFFFFNFECSMRFHDDSDYFTFFRLKNKTQWCTH